MQLLLNCGHFENITLIKRALIVLKKLRCSSFIYIWNIPKYYQLIFSFAESLKASFCAWVSKKFSIKYHFRSKQTGQKRHPPTYDFLFFPCQETIFVISLKLCGVQICMDYCFYGLSIDYIIWSLTKFRYVQISDNVKKMKFHRFSLQNWLLRNRKR